MTSIFNILRKSLSEDKTDNVDKVEDEDVKVAHLSSLSTDADSAALTPKSQCLQTQSKSK